MPVLHRYKNERGYYIRTRVKRAMITYQVTEAGHRSLSSNGYEDGDNVPRRVLKELRTKGLVYTNGAGTVEFEASLKPEPHSSSPASPPRTDWNEVSSRAARRRSQRERQSFPAASARRTVDYDEITPKPINRTPVDFGVLENLLGGVVLVAGVLFILFFLAAVLGIGR